mgnify:FL=1
MIPEILLILALVSGPVNLGGPSVELASHSLSLNNRYAVASVNDVFRYNILHTLDRMGYEFTLNSGESFAFHDDLLPAYSKNVVKTTNSHFNYQDGFKSDGYLMGDGVCHLASVIYWAALDAGLETYVPANHDFAAIPDVPKEYGVSIFSMPGTNADASQNLYIKNNKDKPVKLVFSYENDTLNIRITEDR